MSSGSGPARWTPVNPVRSGRKQRQQDEARCGSVRLGRRIFLTFNAIAPQARLKPTMQFASNEYTLKNQLFERLSESGFNLNYIVASMAPIHSESFINHLLSFWPAYLIVLLAFILAALFCRIGSAIKREPTDALIYAVLILLMIDGLLHGPIKSFLGSMSIVVYTLTTIGFTLFILLRKIINHLHRLLNKSKTMKDKSKK